MTLILVAVILAASLAQGAEAVRFRISFEKGIDWYGDATRAAEGSATDDTYNFDLLPDGTARKRPGTITDAATSIKNGLIVRDGGRAHLDEAGIHLDGQLVSGRLRRLLQDSVAAACAAPDSVPMALHDGKLYASYIKTAATREGRVAVLDLASGAWSIYKGWSPESWGRWKRSGETTYDLFFKDRTDGDVYRIDADAMTDSGTTITAQVETPLFAIPGEVPNWTEVRLVMANSDSVAVYADFRTRQGVYRSVLQRSFDPDVGADTTAEREPREFVIGLRPSTTAGTGGIEAEAMQIRVKAMGSGYCTIHRGELVAERKAR